MRLWPDAHRIAMLDLREPSRKHANRWQDRAPRRTGQKETRYAHLLSGPPSETPAGTGVEIDRAEPRRDRLADLETSLDEVRRELAALRERFEEFTRQFK